MTHDEELMHKRMKRLLKNTEAVNEAGEPTVYFDNYSAMCRQLQLPIKTSNSKKAQINHMQFFCDLQRGEKWSYYFTEVYKNPDLNIINGNMMQKCAEGIFLSYFLKQWENHQEFQILLNQTQLMHTLSFVNSRFGSKQEEEWFLTENNMSSEQLIHFKERVRSRFESVIISALNMLANRCLIEYSKAQIIIYQTEEHKPWEYRVANKDETSRILKYRRKAIEQCGCDNMLQLWSKNLWEKFYTKLDALVQAKEKWISVQPGYYIIPNNEHWLKDGLHRTLEDIKVLREKINQYAVIELDKNAERKYANYQKLLTDDVNKKYQLYASIDDVKSWIPRYVYQGSFMEDNYLENQKKLVNYFIDINYPDYLR